MSERSRDPWQLEKWKPIHIHNAMSNCRDLAALAAECDWKDACMMAAAPAMYSLLREFSGEGGDGFCEGCGRCTGKGAPHSEPCRIAAIIRAVEG